MRVKTLLILLLCTMSIQAEPYVLSQKEELAIRLIFGQTFLEEVERDSVLSDKVERGRDGMYVKYKARIFVSSDPEKKQYFRDNLFIVHEATHLYQDLELGESGRFFDAATGDWYVIYLDKLDKMVNPEEEAEMVRLIACWYLNAFGVRIENPPEVYMDRVITKDSERNRLLIWGYLERQMNIYRPKYWNMTVFNVEQTIKDYFR